MYFCQFNLPGQNSIMYYSYVLPLIVAFAFINTGDSYSQQPNDIEEKTLFSVAIDMNIQYYNQKAEQAFFDQDMERVEALFDSIVENVVKGTYLDNFTVNEYRSKKVSLHSFEKPIFIITYSDWYPFAPGEIAALNQIAAKHHRQIDFLVLFFNSRSRVRKYASKFNNKVHLLYADERANRFDRIIKSMKHSFGVPTVFYIDQDKKFLDVGRMPAHHFQDEFEASFFSKYNYFLNGISVFKIDGVGLHMAKKETPEKNQ